MSPKLNEVWIVLHFCRAGYRRIQGVYSTETAAKEYIKGPKKHAFWTYEIEPWKIEGDSHVPEIRE